MFKYHTPILIFICFFQFCIGFTFSQGTSEMIHEDIISKESDSLASIREGNNISEELSIEFLTNGRFVQNLTDAIEASLTIQVSDGHGSGFFISDDLVVTNYHVIEGQETVSSVSEKGETFFLDVIALDSTLDLAILKADFTSKVYFSLESDNLESMEVGSDIIVIGSPTSKLLSKSLSSGIISGIREFEEITILQTDAKINSGNSGGPLLDSRGNLYGVVTAKINGYGIEGLGFAIPTQYIFKLITK